MSISDILLEKIKKGRVVLFLGSGALFGAKLKKHDIPIGSGLGKLISEEFLNGEFKEESLQQIAELAISEHSLFDVQEFIHDIFDGIIPADYHLKIPGFQWKAIFTTNYDRLIEISYSKSTKRKQNLEIFLSNNDPLSEKNKTNDNLPFVKLHGCITRTRDQDLPLILTVEQYNDYDKNRTSLFKYLYELAIEYPIIFVGHSLQDANIRHIISLVQKNVPQGQRHYLLKPKIKQAEINLWSSKRITALDYEFEVFMDEIDSKINKTERFTYLITPPKKHPIQEIFSTTSLPSEDLIRFLTNDVQYIKNEVSYKISNPSSFYKGLDLGWYPYTENLAIKRSIFDRFFEEVVLNPESERLGKKELIVLKGEAGSGKTVFLRQIAWKLKDSGFGCTLWVDNSEGVNIIFIKEIFDKTNERIFLFWDDASLHSQKIALILSQASKDKIALTIITAERYNEWNTRCEVLKDFVTEIYAMRNLNVDEIDELITRLETHNCLGPNLANKSRQERIKAFTVSFERQLLVSLHEATMGETFEDIIINEYESITPPQAQAIYRTICTLNRLRVPVRAGLIARIFGITFETFKDNFFRPLEKVVLWDVKSNDDVHYSARHSEIAEIVFSRSFDNNLERYNEYIQILDKINVSYESDRLSFRFLIRAKSLNEIFPDYQDVINIYKHAEEVIGEDSYLLQQMANFERIRPNGNLTKAIELLERAKELSPYDSSIYHTLATVWRDKAKDALEPFARMKYRIQARQILNDAIKKWGGNAYMSSSLISLAIDNFEDMLIDVHLSNKVLDETISDIEKEITNSQQKFPDDDMLFTLEARFATILRDDSRVVDSLMKSFSDSNRDPYIAIRLSKIFVNKNDIPKALATLLSAIERRRTDQKLNFQYAEVLRFDGKSDCDILAYYYRRAFTPGDKNYNAKFWFARFSSESIDKNNIMQSEEIFEELRNIRASKEEILKIRDYQGGKATPITHYGTVKKINTGFGFISIDGSGKELFFHRKEVEGDLWEALKIGDRVKFQVGYSYSGPACCNIVPN